MKQRRQSKRVMTAGKLARGAIITALGCALILVAYPLEALDLTMAAAAAVLIWVMRLEYGSVFALLVYAATAMLSLLLMPSNSGAACYLFIFGWYPVYKAFLEIKVRKKWPVLLLKVAAVVSGFALLVLIFFKTFVGDMDFSTLMEDIARFVSIEPGGAALWFDEKVLFGLNRLQWIFIGAYLLFAPCITLLYDLLLTKFAILYAVKVRPILVKAGIFKKH